MENRKAVSLITTKLNIPPLQRELVPRPRLIDRLNQGMEKKLTLVSSPAGYGKTMLLSAWADQSTIPAAWISLDEGDNDPARFLAYLVAALDKIKPGIGKHLSALLSSPQLPPPEEWLSGLINEIDQMEQPFALILDDYHLISEQSIHEALIYLFNHLPSQMRLVIATRADPPVQLARLRARSELAELRLADLCFTPAEAGQLFNAVMGLGLEQDQVAALAARTEGWIAGLQMAAISLRGIESKPDFIRSFSGSNRYILDYLVEEVLRSQTQEIQSFLMKTSILDRLSASLCDEVADQRDSQAMLEGLERANLFILPLDEERSWYRYHQLFRDLLCKRAQQIYHGEVASWHRRASLWFERHGSLEEAIEHSLAAEDHQHAAELIEAIAQPTLIRSEFNTFRGWVRRLPEGIVRSRPNLVVYYAWVLVLVDSNDTVAAWLKSVDISSPSMAGKVGVIRGYLEFMQGEVVRAAILLQQSLARLPAEESLFRSVAAWLLSLSSVATGDFGTGSQALEEVVQASVQKRHWVVAAGALCALAEIHLRLGQLHQAREHYERALTVARDARGRLPVAARALMGLAELGREWNDLERASSDCLEGIELAKHLREVTAIAGYLTLAYIRQVGGDAQGSEEAVQKAGELALQTDITNLDDLYVGLVRAKLAILRGDLAAAGDWVQERGLLGELDPAVFDQKDNYYQYHIMKYELLVMARWLIAGDQPQKALDLLAILHKKMEEQGRIHLVIESLLLRSIAYQMLGDRVQALACFNRCLVMAEPGGYVRLFLDGGPEVKVLLQEAVKSGTATVYAERLLAAFETGSPPSEGNIPVPQLQPSSPSGLPETLTEREIELLSLIAQGLSNQEIARRLFISLPTVKWHTGNIYGKLGVRSRTQAVVQARFLGILPPG